MEKLYRLEELSPCVREVGLQMRDSWRTRPRRIYDHEILYCFRGNAAIHIGGAEQLIAEGDLVIIPPDTPHTFWVDETKDGELYYLHCDFEYRDDSEWVYEYYNTPELYTRLFSGELQEREHLRPRALFFDGRPLPTFVSFADSDEVDVIFRTLYKLYIRKGDLFYIESKILMLRLLKEIFAAQGCFAPTTSSNNERICGIIKNFKNAVYIFCRINKAYIFRIFISCKYFKLLFSIFLHIRKLFARALKRCKSNASVFIYLCIKSFFLVRNYISCAFISIAFSFSYYCALF